MTMQLTMECAVHFARAAKSRVAFSFPLPQVSRKVRSSPNERVTTGPPGTIPVVLSRRSSIKLQGPLHQLRSRSFARICRVCVASRIQRREAESVLPNSSVMSDRLVAVNKFYD